MMRRMLILPLLAALLAGASGSAAVLTFFGEDTGLGDGGGRGSVGPLAGAAHAAFLLATTDAVTDDLEDEPETNGEFLEFGPGLFGDAFSILPGIENLPVGDTQGRFPTSGDQYWELGGPEEAGPNYLMDIYFRDAEDFLANKVPVTAFGFFATDLGDYMKRLRLTFEDVNGVVIDQLMVPHTYSINGAQPQMGGRVSFFGYLNTAGFARVVFEEVFAGVPGTTPLSDGFGFDDFMVARAKPPVIPEPGTMALLGAGLVAVARRRRRR